MPDKQGDENRDDNHDNDSDRRSASSTVTISNYHRAICHAKTPFNKPGPVIPTDGTNYRSPPRQSLASLIVGACVALLLLALSLHRARSHCGYYDGEVYAMNAGTHRRWAAAWLAFGIGFLLAMRAPWTSQWVWAPFGLAAVLYLTSFLRGYASEHE